MSERMQSAADHAKEVAARQKGQVAKAAHKAEAYLQDLAAEAKDRLAPGPAPPGRQGQLGAGAVPRGRPNRLRGSRRGAQPLAPVAVGM